MVCFQQVYPFRVIAGQMHCRRPILGCSLLAVDGDEAMGWVNCIPVGVVAGVVVRAVRGPPVKGGVYLRERFYNCNFFGYKNWRQRLEPRAGTGEYISEAEDVGQDEEEYDDSLY